MSNKIDSVIWEENNNVDKFLNNFKLNSTWYFNGVLPILKVKNIINYDKFKIVTFTYNNKSFGLIKKNKDKIDIVGENLIKIFNKYKKIRFTKKKDIDTDSDSEEIFKKNYNIKNIFKQGIIGTHIESKKISIKISKDQDISINLDEFINQNLKLSNTLKTSYKKGFTRLIKKYSKFDKLGKNIPVNVLDEFYSPTYDNILNNHRFDLGNIIPIVQDSEYYFTSNPDLLENLNENNNFIFLNDIEQILIYSNYYNKLKNYRNKQENKKDRIIAEHSKFNYSDFHNFLSNGNEFDNNTFGNILGYNEDNNPYKDFIGLKSFINPDNINRDYLSYNLNFDNFIIRSCIIDPQKEPCSIDFSENNFKIKKNPFKNNRIPKRFSNGMKLIKFCQREHVINKNTRTCTGLNSESDNSYYDNDVELVSETYSEYTKLLPGSNIKIVGFYIKSCNNLYKKNTEILLENNLGNFGEKKIYNLNFNSNPYFHNNNKINNDNEIIRLRIDKFDKHKYINDKNYVIYFSDFKNKNKKSNKIEINDIKDIFLNLRDIFETNSIDLITNHSLINFKKIFNNFYCKTNILNQSLFKDFFFSIDDTPYHFNITTIINQNSTMLENYMNKKYNNIKVFNIDSNISNKIQINFKNILDSFNKTYNINNNSIEDEIKIYDKLLKENYEKIKKNDDKELENKLYNQTGNIIVIKKELQYLQHDINNNNLKNFYFQIKNNFRNKPKINYSWKKKDKWYRSYLSDNIILNNKKIYPPIKITNEIEYVLKIKNTSILGEKLAIFLNKYSLNYKNVIVELYNKKNINENWYFYNPKILSNVNVKICCKHYYYLTNIQNPNDNIINTKLLEECVKNWGTIDNSSNDKIICKNCGEIISYNKYSEFEGIEKGSGKVINFRELDLSDFQNKKLSSFEIRLRNELELILTLIKLNLKNNDITDLIKLVSNIYSENSIKNNFNLQIDYSKIMFRFQKDRVNLKSFLITQRWLLSSYYCYNNKIKFDYRDTQKMTTGEYYQNALNDIDIIINKINEEQKNDNKSWLNWGKKFNHPGGNKKLNFIRFRSILDKILIRESEKKYNIYWKTEVLKYLLASICRIITTSSYKYNLFSLKNRESIKETNISVLNIYQYPESSCNMFSKIILYQKKNKNSIWFKILKDIHDDLFIDDVVNYYRNFYNSNIVMTRIKNTSQINTSLNYYTWNNFLPNIYGEGNNFINKLNKYINIKYDLKNISSTYRDSVLPYNIKNKFNNFDDYDIDYYYKNINFINEIVDYKNAFKVNKLKFNKEKKTDNIDYNNRFIKKNLIINIDNGLKRVYIKMYDYTGIYDKFKYLNMTDKQYQKNIYLIINKLYNNEDTDFVNNKIKIIYFLIKNYKDSVKNNLPIKNYVEIDTLTGEFKNELYNKYNRIIQKSNSKDLLMKLENVINKKQILKTNFEKNSMKMEDNFNKVLESFNINNDEKSVLSNLKEFKVDKIFQELEDDYFIDIMDKISNRMKIEGYDSLDKHTWDKELEFRTEEIKNSKLNLKIKLNISIIKFILKSIYIINNINNIGFQKSKEWYNSEENTDDFRFRNLYNVFNKKNNNNILDFVFINELNIKYLELFEFNNKNIHINHKNSETINNFINNLYKSKNSFNILNKLKIIINILVNKINNSEFNYILTSFVSEYVNNNFISDTYIQEKYEFKKNEESSGRKKSSDKLLNLDKDLYNVMFFKRQFNLGKVGFSSNNNEFNSDDYNELNLKPNDLNEINKNIYNDESLSEASISNVKSSEEEGEY
jgi:hypothetical protein